ncbi:MAG: hypothetical protein NTY15_11300 [Planctomycetota bacterium]|nr:hypothetical protein [Planctomycetota bacterium]
MTLPLSWVVAGAIPAGQAAKQTVNLAATSASHFFGELLQTSPSPKSPVSSDSGPSAPISSSQNPKSSNDSKSWADRVESLRSRLSDAVKQARLRYGLSPEASPADAVSISANGTDKPVLNGPEPLRSELEKHLHENPELVKEINELASQSKSSSPLRLLPQQESSASANEPWTLWLDAKSAA